MTKEEVKKCPPHHLVLETHEEAHERWTKNNYHVPSRKRYRKIIGKCKYCGYTKSHPIGRQFEETYKMEAKMSLPGQYKTGARREWSVK